MLNSLHTVVIIFDNDNHATIVTVYVVKQGIHSLYIIKLRKIKINDGPSFMPNKYTHTHTILHAYYSFIIYHTKL